MSPRARNPGEYLDTYAPELALMDAVLAHGSSILRFAERSKATAARHRIYRARLADRERVRAEALATGMAGSSPYEKIRVKSPSLSPDGLVWLLPIELVEGIESIDGLLGFEPKERSK